VQHRNINRTVHFIDLDCRAFHNTTNKIWITQIGVTNLQLWILQEIHKSAYKNKTKFKTLTGPARCLRSAHHGILARNRETGDDGERALPTVRARRRRHPRRNPGYPRDQCSEADRLRYKMDPHPNPSYAAHVHGGAVQWTRRWSASRSDLARPRSVWSSCMSQEQHPS